MPLAVLGVTQVMLLSTTVPELVLYPDLVHFCHTICGGRRYGCGTKILSVFPACLSADCGVVRVCVGMVSFVSMYTHMQCTPTCSVSTLTSCSMPVRAGPFTSDVGSERPGVSSELTNSSVSVTPSIGPSEWSVRG